MRDSSSFLLSPLIRKVQGRPNTNWVLLTWILCFYYRSSVEFNSFLTLKYSASIWKIYMGHLATLCLFARHTMGTAWWKSLVWVPWPEALHVVLLLCPGARFYGTAIRWCWHSEFPSRGMVLTFPDCAGFLSFTRVRAGGDILQVRLGARPGPSFSDSSTDPGRSWGRPTEVLWHCICQEWC